jgi:hypothetical protein
MVDVRKEYLLMPIPNTNSLGYQGLKETNPPNIVVRQRDPEITDFKEYDVGDLWYNKLTPEFFILNSKEANIAIWLPITAGTGLLNTLTGDDGLVVNPSGLNIDLLGGATGAIKFSNGGLGQMDAAVQVDNVTIGIVGNQLTFIGVIPPSFTWIEVAIPTLMAPNTGYIANAGGLVPLTLPAVAPVGTIQEVAGKGAGLWQLMPNVGQTIYFGNQTTTPGGNITTFTQRGCVRLVCITADTEWDVLSSQGNFNVV